MSYLWYWPAGGWDFEQWKAQHPWQPAHGPQTGHPELLPLLGRKEGLKDWKARRSELLSITRDILGDLTDKPPRKPRWETLEVRPMPCYEMRRIRYLLTDEEWGYAWVLTPKTGRGRRPAVIALHQTMPQGKDEAVGISGNPELAYGAHLAERGFITIAPDAIGFGERKKDDSTSYYHSAREFFARHPQGSAMGKMVFDVQRMVDVLRQMPGVDGSRIGCIGHSHGGYGTLFAMLFEPRIKAGVISCGVTMFRSDPHADRWWRKTALMPRLGYYEGAMEQTPVDFHHWLALLAPRPLMLSAALNDGIFPETDNLKQVADMVARVYDLYGAADRFQRWIFKGEHRFPAAARTRAYKLLESVLRLTR